MKKRQKVLIKNHSTGDFEAYIWNVNELYETADVVLELPESADDEVATMTFGFADIEIID